MDEREELEALTASEGWRTFAAHVAREWGTEEGGGARFLNAVRAAASERADSDATEKLRQIVVAQREVHNVMAWPERRLKELTARALQPMERSLSRRGGL